jgi:hypothetical protein
MLPTSMLNTAAEAVPTWGPEELVFAAMPIEEESVAVKVNRRGAAFACMDAAGRGLDAHLRRPACHCRRLGRTDSGRAHVLGDLAQIKYFTQGGRSPWSSGEAVAEGNICDAAGAANRLLLLSFSEDGIVARVLDVS